MESLLRKIESLLKKIKSLLKKIISHYFGIKSLHKKSRH